MLHFELWSLGCSRGQTPSTVSSQEIHALAEEMQPSHPAGLAGQATLLLVPEMLAQHSGDWQAAGTRTQESQRPQILTSSSNKAPFVGLGCLPEGIFPSQSWEAEARVVCGMASMLLTQVLCFPGCPAPVPERTDGQSLTWIL